MSASVNISDLAKWPKVMVGKYHREIVKQIQISVKMRGPMIVQAIIDGTKPYPPVHTGEYRRNMKVRDLSNGALLYNPTKRAGIIERGRRPGFGVSRQGQEDLARWVHLHGMDRATGRQMRFARSRFVKKGGAARFKRLLEEDRARSIAFLIARSIKRRGLPAKYIFARAKPLIVESVLNDVDAVMVRGVA